MLNFYILFDRMAPRIGCGDRQHQSNRQIGAHSWLHPCRASMKQGSGLRRLFGDFKGSLCRQMECGRQDGGTSPVCLRQLRRLDKSLIGIAIYLHQLAKPSTNLTQPMLHSSLPAKARSHNPQRGREGAHQGRNRAAGWDRGRRCHRGQKA